MKLQPAVKKETLRIAAGTGIGVAVMLAVFALMGRMSGPVALSGILGGVIAVVNFLFLGVTVQRVAAQAEEARGRKIMQFSYNIRMLLMLVWIILAVTFPVFNWVAAALPLLFPRITIAVMQLTGYYNKQGAAPENADPQKEE